MKIVVMGGRGLIGSQLVNLLTQQGHEAIPASPSTGVNAVTGEGLAAVLAGADVVVDVTNSPSFADDDVLAFFDTSTKNLLAAEAAAEVGHHVALSIVGCDRIPDSGYMRAKVAQEKRIQAGSVPYTIVRATQFHEFLCGIADASLVDGKVMLPPAPIQPIAASEVTEFLAEVAGKTPTNETIDLAGPERLRIDQAVQQALTAQGDRRTVTTDPYATYFGTQLKEDSIVPTGAYVKGKQTLTEWLKAATVNVH
ncbi:SDR family oxidoreductase [Blastopirellula marina]|uniref:NmrA family transcriptional regulator n=1 Tax=Blastopirellula marina TaxID=124 RepID=A0A2S8F6T2_9BACT|nr:SDR family oxidoreductase [Blastopirellula marina]PQO27862.1 NmrA family transcriptional regulator [Blastopirellula marina]PTL41597.1 NmrA family transcriptional regulator [Blastopirellula marina]